MNDQDEPGFDDPEYDELRALLADARVTEPVPTDVAARLDATLASLQAERTAESPVVVPLRRRFGRVLVAAAAAVAIVTGGYGISQLPGTTSADSGDAASSGAADSDAGAGTTDDDSAVAPELAKTAREPRLTTTSFAADAARVMVDLNAVLSKETASDVPRSTTSSSDGNLDSLDGRTPSDYAGLEAPPVTATPQRAAASRDAAIAACPGPEAADAITLPATLDGSQVALVFRPPTGDSQRVEAWSCDGTTMLAS